jgi:hypothetical protein
MLTFLIAMQLVFIADANPVIYYEIPTEPDANPPLVTVNSPTQNQTYASQNITLSFTITKPETYIILTKYSDTVHIFLGNITSFYYVVDGVESQSVLIQDISSVYSENPQRTFEFSLNFRLPEGHHSLLVAVEGDTIYRQGGRESRVTDPPLSRRVQGVSEVINFTIAKPPEPFPTTLVVAPIASFVVIGAGLLLYFKKRKH